MTAVLEKDKILSPVLERKKFTVTDISQMVKVGILPEESGWELINGEIIHHMTVGSKHAGTVNKVNLILNRSVADKYIVAVQNPIRIDADNEPEPDISVLKMREDFYAESHPEPVDILLVIEVSVSTVDFDREIKRKLYAQAGIGEYWLIDVEKGLIESYTKPKNGEYFEKKIYERDKSIRSKQVGNLELNVSEIIPKENK